MASDDLFNVADLTDDISDYKHNDEEPSSTTCSKSIIFVDTLIAAVKSMNVDNSPRTQISTLVNQIMTNLQDYKVLSTFNAKTGRKTEAVLKNDSLSPTFTITSKNVGIFQKEKKKEEDPQPMESTDVEAMETTDVEMGNAQNVRVFPAYTEQNVQYFYSAYKYFKKSHNHTTDIIISHISQGVQAKSVQKQVREYLKGHRYQWRKRLEKTEKEIHQNTIKIMNDTWRSSNGSFANPHLLKQQITFCVENALDKRFKTTLVPLKDQRECFNEFIQSQKTRILINEMTYFLTHVVQSREIPQQEPNNNVNDS